MVWKVPQAMEFYYLRKDPKLNEVSIESISKQRIDDADHAYEYIKLYIVEYKRVERITIPVAFGYVIASPSRNLCFTVNVVAVPWKVAPLSRTFYDAFYMHRNIAPEHLSAKPRE